MLFNWRIKLFLFTIEHSDHKQQAHGPASLETGKCTRAKGTHSCALSRQQSRNKNSAFLDETHLFFSDGNSPDEGPADASSQYKHPCTSAHETEYEEKYGPLFYLNLAESNKIRLRWLVSHKHDKYVLK